MRRARRFSPGRDKLDAAPHQFGDLIPIDLADVQAERDPTARANIGGKIKSLGLRRGQCLVLAGQNFAGDRDDAISVMIVQKIREGLLAREKLGVAAEHLALGAGEREADFRDAREARVFG